MNKLRVTANSRDDLILATRGESEEPSMVEGSADAAE